MNNRVIPTEEWFSPFLSVNASFSFHNFEGFNKNLKGPGIRKYLLKNEEYGLLKLEAILVSWSRGSVLIFSMSSLTHVIDTKESPK